MSRYDETTGLMLATTDVVQGLVDILSECGEALAPARIVIETVYAAYTYDGKMLGHLVYDNGGWGYEE